MSDLVHFLGPELKVIMHCVPIGGGAVYRHQAYHELHTACGHRFTSGGHTRRGWVITTTAELVSCGRCHQTQAWRSEIRRLLREGTLTEAPSGIWP